jgi:Zn-dependent protease
MNPFQSGSLRLFRFSGIQVYLHWSWLLVAVYQISTRPRSYSSMLWNVAEYLALFGIVLLHEFGHAFASRQVGGQSREILLWPFGGIAFVRVPPRPGAELWSIAAGPLVNVVLWPLLALAFLALAGFEAWRVLFHPGVFFRFAAQLPDAIQFIGTVFFINFFVLLFNVLPIYPMDGGQILRSLLWFGFGRVRSLQIATIIGFVGIGLLGVRAVLTGSVYSGLMALFLAQQCFLGWKHAQALRVQMAAPRHVGFSCPTCHEPPPGGPMWLCGQCRHPFDPFSTQGVCPHCAALQAATPCPYCGAAAPLGAWGRGAAAGATIDV